MAERQFGPYRLVRQVAVGGMAEIHLAKTKGIAGFEKYVAVKVIHPNFAEDEQFIQMLVDEAKIAVQLTHGNIAQTFDLGRVGPTYYITMEYIDGADLYKVLRKGSEIDLEMPLDVCAFVGKEVASALDYAHRKKDVGGKPLGIVHRDVSPQNVLVSYAGEVKLVDFGIAKATSKAKQTAIGVIKGKYYYMSPEQAWGDPIDYRSDIFSAGIVLYEMITGQMLYLEEDLHKLLDMARKAEIAPPSTLRAGIPPQLEKIVMHALKKVPGERYQSAGDLATDLERFLHAYSPVFTAAKLSNVLRSVVGEPPQIPVAAEESYSSMEVRDGPTSTHPLPLDAVAHNKEEIRDENSVIFRMDDLKASGNAPRGKPTPAAGAKAAPVAPASKPRPAPSPNPAAMPAPRVTRATADLPELPARMPLKTPAAGAAQPSKVPTGKIPSIAKPAAPVVAPAQARPVSRTRQLDEETREMNPAPGDPDNEMSGLLTLEPAKRAAAANPAPKRVKTWADAVDTHPIEEDLENIGERTQITKSPSAGGYSDASEDDVRYDSGPDATMITAAPRPGTGPDALDLEEQTNPSHDEAELAAAIDAAIRNDGAGAGVIGDDDETNDEDEEAPTMTGENHGPDDDGPTMQRDFRERPATAKPRAPRTARHAATAPPALAAKIHTPAVSELRKPRASRRTPPGGVPSQSSVLQAIVGAQTSEPMPTPRPMAAQPTPTAVVPFTPPTPPPQQVAVGSYQPPAYTPAAYAQPLPGMGPPPGQAPPPPSYPPMQGYGSYSPGPSPYIDPQQQQQQQLQPPYNPAQPAQGPYVSPGALYAYQPFGPPPTPPTITGQLRLTEGDELPAHLQLGGSKRWIKLMFAGLLAVSAAAAATYFLLRATRDASPTIGAIRVESSPPGAEISLDGQRLSDVTPFTIEGVPVGTRHEIVVKLARYTSDTKTVDVPKTGGETEVTAILKPVTGVLKVVSSPTGAEIRLDGINRGITPRTITDIEMGSAKKLELRLKDYQVYSQQLAWPDKGEIDLDVKLQK